MGAEASSRKIAYEKPHDEHGFYFGNCTRFYILAISTLCLTLIVGNSLVLNFTTICMVKDAPGIGSSGLATNATSVEMYDTVEASWLFSATAVGVIVGTIPITYLTDKMGFR
ncbi:Protein F11A5.9 [Aphelenchoides avenae]|nr:Protein F11A5.9 [Aphelenchus avenae]